MKKIPQATIQRLVVYYRYLNIIAKRNEEEVICTFFKYCDIDVFT